MLNFSHIKPFQPTHATLTPACERSYEQLDQPIGALSRGYIR